MLIGILVFALIGAAIYFFLTKKFDPESFSGTYLGCRVTGKLLDVIKPLQSESPMSYITDCSNNIIWKKGDAAPSSSTTAMYTILFKTNAQLPPSSMIINKGQLNSKWSDALAHPIASNVPTKSILLSNSLQDMSLYAALPDQEYVKKIMSLVTNEYPANAC